MTATRPIVAVVYAEATAPVVRAQTPPLLAAFRAAGRRVDAAVFTSPRALFLPSARQTHRRALAAFAQAAGHEPIRRTHYPRDRGLDALGGSLAKDLAKRGLTDAILLCRQPRAAMVGASARDALAARGEASLRVVLDLRGLRDAEYLMTLGKREDALDPPERRRLMDYRAQEEIACRRADAVLTVSRPMERHVVQRYGIEPAKVGHVPNHAESVPESERWRGAARADLGVEPGSLVVMYSGTLAAWQMPEASIRLFRGVRGVRSDARLVFLTPDTETAQQVLAREGVTDALVRSAPPGEAAKLLCAADYGLLLRQDDTVNRVACPVKFGEYLACGIRPVLSPHIGDQSDLMQATGLGVVVGLANPQESGRLVALDAEKPGSVDPTGREKRRAWAEANISPARAAARIGEFLEKSLGA